MSSGISGFLNDEFQRRMFEILLTCQPAFSCGVLIVLE